MKVIIPNIAVPEVSYIFHCLLHVFLGLEYELVIGEKKQDYVIEIGKYRLFIKNLFFNNNNPPDLYQKKNIPAFVKNGRIAIGNRTFQLCSLYGDAALTEMSNGFILRSDIVAASFFMLTRWEEMATTERDVHGRFSAGQSLAWRAGFLERPVVNEYVEILWALLQKAGLRQKRKARTFSIVPTHDVDHPFMFYNPYKTLKAIVSPFIINNNRRDSYTYLKYFLKRKDPFDTHDVFLELAGRSGCQPWFFFIAGGAHQYDPVDLSGHRKVKFLIKKLKEKKAGIGFHPSYSTYNDAEFFQKEKNKIEKAFGLSVVAGRQHYLRFALPLTWRIWEEAGMEWDSTLGYPDSPGFRCGVCYEFPVFDIEQRIQLNLTERPLIVMDMTLIAYLGLPVAQAMEKVKKLMLEVEKYDGEFVFLWHNSSIVPAMFSPYLPVLHQMYMPAK